MRPLKEWTNGTPENNYQDGTQLDAADFESWSKELVAVLASAGIAPDAGEFDQLLTAIRKIAWNDPAERPTTLAGFGITDGLTHIASGQPLPSQNIGPVWHDDYNSLMTWQVFNANGAAYTGYASVLVGSLLADTQPTPRAGYVKSGVQNLSRSTYAALRGWAMHNGVMVALGTWAAGRIAVADNADGTTFRAFDVRGEFPRYWDDGRGVDAGRGFGSVQAEALKSHTHEVRFVQANGYSGALGSLVVTRDSPPTANGEIGSGVQTGTYGGSETRPRNTALLASIKF